jgi:hypothetical protein
LKAADTGSTTIARVGADSDTLETLSDQMDAIKSDTANILADTGTDGVLISSGTGSKQIDLSSGKVLLQPTQTGVTIPTVTNLTNLPTMPTDWVTAAGIKADAVTKIQTGLATAAALAIVSGYVDDLETRLTAARAGYLDKLNVTGTLANTDNANNFKADVSNLALEATLTAIKGSGWSNETLKAIKEYVDELESRLTAVRAGYLDKLTKLDANVSSRLATSGYTAPDNANILNIKAKTDNLPTSPAATGDAMTLTAAYDHAKDDVLTPLGVVDSVVDAIKLKTDNIPANPATAGEYTASLAAIQSDVSGIPDAILTKAIVDTLTVEQVLKVLAAVETGITTGGGTDTIVYTGKDGTEIRLTGVDEDGNRTAVIVTLGA